MQKIRKPNKVIRVLSFVLDIVVLSYFVLYIYWMFAVKSMDTHPLTTVFTTVNPMTTGTYCLGVALVLHIFSFQNILGRCLICIAYIFSVVVSLIAVMGMTGWNDLLMYVPHVFIIIAAIATLIITKVKAE